MSMYQTFLSDLTGAITAKAGIDLTGQFTTYNVAASAVSGYNTSIVVKIKPGSTLYTGEKQVWYNRVDLGSLSTLLVNCYHASFPVGATTTELMGGLTDWLGLRFETGDLTEEAVYIDTDFVPKIKLKAATTSKSYIGEVILNLGPLGSFPSLFVASQLPPF